MTPLNIVIFGLSITSAWGNGHATTYRALVNALHQRGHRVRFFERDTPWYAQHRDLSAPAYCKVDLYSRLEELEQYTPILEQADLVIVGSYVPDGRRLIEWLLPRARGLKAFYDIDTPVTLSRLVNGTCEYLDRDLAPRFDLYLSFAGGPALEQLRAEFDVARPRVLYCSVEPRRYYPIRSVTKCYDLGYLGTYSEDRQPALERLLLEPARCWARGRFYVAGAQYPPELSWPDNVRRSEHLEPAKHRAFYNHQRFTLNVTRADMVANGYSPSVRLFEAAACGVTIISDSWPGLEEFFTPGREILLARSASEVLDFVRHPNEAGFQAVGERARQRVLGLHTAEQRARELESYVQETLCEAPPRRWQPGPGAVAL